MKSTWSQAPHLLLYRGPEGKKHSRKVKKCALYGKRSSEAADKISKTGTNVGGNRGREAWNRRVMVWLSVEVLQAGQR